MAQVVELFSRDDLAKPLFVFHELALTDGASHDYGPHGDGLKSALDETDRRVGRVLDLLEAHGLYDETLFIVTADHGMAPQNVSLRANPEGFNPRRSRLDGTSCAIDLRRALYGTEA